MPKIDGHSWLLTPSYYLSHQAAKCLDGPSSVQPQSNGFVSATKSLAQTGFITLLIVCRSPGSTLSIRKNLRYVNGSLGRRQNRLSGGISIVGIGCLLISMSLLNSIVV